METAAAVLRELMEEPKRRTTRKKMAPARSEFANALPPQRLSTGVRRLDDLLGGGLPQGSATLLYGAPFTGKGVLQREFFLQGLKAQQPNIFMLTDTSANEMSRVMAFQDEEFSKLEETGNAAYIDLYTKLIGDCESNPHATYLEAPSTWEDVLSVVDRLDRAHQKIGPRASRLIVQSISSLMVELGPASTFKFLRMLLGRFCRKGGTAIVAIEAGMHDPHEVQTIKHLCSGMISTREHDEKYFLRVEGLPCAFQPGWVEYDFDHNHFELVGSFASGRIRGAPLLAQ